MTISTVAHINLRGTARQALEHYQSVFGGDVVVVTYRDAHSVTEEAEADQVMWGQVTSPDGFHLMAYDVPAARPHDPGVTPFFVSVRGTDSDQIAGYWDRLTSDTGSDVVVPLAPAGWAPLYGMATDRFGVTWVLDVLPSSTGGS